GEEMMRQLLAVIATIFVLSCAQTPAPPVSQPASAAATKAGAAAPEKVATKTAAGGVQQAGLRASTTSEPPPYQPPNEPWRMEKPAGGPPPEIKLPHAQVAKLKNGLEVLLVEMHHLPVVSTQLIVFAGGERAKPAQAGLPSLVAALLTEGTTQHDSVALS